MVPRNRIQRSCCAIYTCNPPGGLCIRNTLHEGTTSELFDTTSSSSCEKVVPCNFVDIILTAAMRDVQQFDLMTNDMRMTRLIFSTWYLLPYVLVSM